MNTRISWKTSRTVFLILLGLIFLSHFPFLHSDPDRNMSVGRGPFTDEGLNTIQVRNWINHSELSFTECDNLLKTPLFGFPLALTYRIFGTGWTVSRLHVLILVFLALLWIGFDKRNGFIIPILLLICLLQYQVFQSSHFSMAEMLSVAAILLAINFFSRSSEENANSKLEIRKSILAGAFLSLSYYFKIQFIYMLPLFPILFIIIWIRRDYKDSKRLRNQFLATIGTLVFFILIYFLGWYLPNKEAYDFMMAHQSGEITFSARIFRNIGFNLSYHFIKGWLQIFIYLFIILIITGFAILKKTTNRKYPLYFFSALTWFILELHKLMMVYLPTRYQVSLLVSMGLLMSVVINEMLQMNFIHKKIPAKPLAVSFLLILFTINIYNYSDELTHRTYAIREANRYLAQHLTKNDLVLGTWGAALTWESGSKALPVWNNFLNYKDPIYTYHPKLVVSETDEQESEQAWKSQGIDLKSLSDSVKVVRIGQWNVGMYWLK
jgi:hypothetical protein